MERDAARETNGKAHKRPLYLRMYQDQVYVDLARLINYQGMPLAEARAGIAELSKTHDKERMVKACEELFDISAEFVRLKAEPRKLCHQLLGAPPEYQVTPVHEFLGLDKPEPAKEAAKPAPKPAEKPARPNKPNYGKKAVEPQKVKETTIKKKPASGGKPPSEADQKAGAESTTSDSAPAPATPIMKQYREAKEKHPDVILLFRIGDFYEAFSDDAERLHKLLGLTLTTRDRMITDRCAMKETFFGVK